MPPKPKTHAPQRQTQSQAHKLIAAFSPQTPNREQIDGTSGKVIGEEEGKEHTRQGERKQEEGSSGCDRNLRANCPKLMPLEDNLLQTQPQAKKLTPRSLRLCSLPTPNPKPRANRWHIWGDIRRGRRGGNRRIYLVSNFHMPSIGRVILRNSDASFEPPLRPLRWLSVVFFPSHLFGTSYN